jgi:hypothetical protein
LHGIIESSAVTEPLGNKGEEASKVINCHPLRLLIAKVVNEADQE